MQVKAPCPPHIDTACAVQSVGTGQRQKTLLAQWWPLLLIIVGVAAILRPRRVS
jgi:hypothetical protein